MNLSTAEFVITITLLITGYLAVSRFERHNQHHINQPPERDPSPAPGHTPGGGDEHAAPPRAEGGSTRALPPPPPGPAFPPRDMLARTVWIFDCGDGDGCVWTWDRVSRRKQPVVSCAGHRVPGDWAEWEGELSL